MASQQKLDELATDYIAGHLSEVEAEEFARLMATHPELRIKVNRLEKTVGLVLNELPLMEPPPHLRATILAQAAAPVLSPQRSLPRSLPQRSLWVWGLGALAIGATVLSAVLGLSNQRLRLANQQLQQELLAAMPAQQAQLILQQPTTRFYDFAGTDQATAAFGSMIVDTDGLQAAIAFQNLPPLPTEQTYALWVLHEGQYIPCGDLQTGPDGAVFATLPMPPVYQSRPWVTDVIVTVESTPLPAQPTGPIIAATI
ncbi:MAG: anti-sigma factor [Cyanobacteria bacterium P01_H01_bin.152]